MHGKFEEKLIRSSTMLSIAIEPQHEDETTDEFTDRISTYIHNTLRNLLIIQTELKNGKTVKNLDETTTNAILKLDFNNIGLNTGHNLDGKPIVIVS
jgi:myo-inositol-hexaphosphate 3-phosphohydrolase